MKHIKYVKLNGCVALLLFFITACITAGYLHAAELQPAPLPQIAPPEIRQAQTGRTLWSIDTRTASFRRGTPLPEAGVCVFKKEDGCWRDASRAELGAVNEQIPLVVFFHGMWLDRAGGRQEGMRLYNLLKKNAPDRPFQMVIWSWPAQRHRCAPRKDVRVKVCRTDTQAFYVAQWIDSLPKNRPICLVGYSLGARIVSGSLELLGGGTVGGQSLRGLAVECPQNEVHVLKGPHQVDAIGEASPRRPLRAALVAAAIDNGSFVPGHRNDLALTQVERLLVTRNQTDHVLRWYSALYRIGGPKAMGFTGPCVSQLGDDADRLDVLSVSCVVGRDHYWMSYLRSCALQRELLELALEPSMEEVVPVD